MTFSHRLVSASVKHGQVFLPQFIGPVCSSIMTGSCLEFAVFFYIDFVPFLKNQRVPELIPTENGTRKGPSVTCSMKQ